MGPYLLRRTRREGTSCRWPITVGVEEHSEDEETFPCSADLQGAATSVGTGAGDYEFHLSEFALFYVFFVVWFLT